MRVIVVCTIVRPTSIYDFSMFYFNTLSTINEIKIRILPKMYTYLANEMAG